MDSSHPLHFHYISSDKTKGGHVLDFAINEGEIFMEACRDLDIYFPKHITFAETNLNVEMKEKAKKTFSD